MASYPAFGRVDDRETVTRFVVFSTQRSGSTWLIDMLNSHPAIVAYGELFLPTGTGHPPFGERDLPFFNTYAVANRARRGLLGGLGGRRTFTNELFAPRAGARAVGFKLMYSQVRRNAWLLGYFTWNRVRVVHLIRRNVLDTIISREAARQRGQYHAESEGEVQDGKIRLDTSTLIARLTHEERKIRWARRLPALLRLPTHEAFYEELASNEREYERVLRFLGVSSTGRPESSLKKLNRAPHAELIENYAGVADTLRGTRFAAFLRNPTASARREPASSRG